MILKRGVKGSVTVFCLMLAMSVIVLITSLFDILRLYYAVSTFGGYSAESITAVMASGQDQYRSTIGFCFIGESEEEIADRLRGYFEKLHADEEVLGVSLSVEPVVQGAFLSDSPETAYLAIREYMAFNMDGDDYDRCEASVCEFSREARKAASVQEKLLSINMCVMELIEPDLGGGFLDYWYRELSGAPYGSEVSQKKYGKRFSGQMMRWCEDPRMTEARFAMNKTSQNLRDSTDAALHAGTYVLASFPMFEWYDGYACATYGEWFERFVNMMLYADVFLTDASSGRHGSSGLAGEYEYLLYGDRCDRWNITKACEQIMYLRYTFNLYAIASDEALYGRLDAEEAVRNRQMIAWAIRESIRDVKTLLAGGRVPTVKKAAEFATEYDTAIPEITAGSGSAGRSYREYLWELSLFSAGSGQVVCSETMYARWLDWIGYATGLDVERTPLYTYCYLMLEIDFEPVSAAGCLIDLEDVGCLNFELTAGEQP